MRIRAPERNTHVRVQGREGFEGMALGGMVGEGGEGRKESKRKKGRERGEAVDAGFGGRSPLRAISGRAVFRGSQNGRHPHQAPPLG